MARLDPAIPVGLLLTGIASFASLVQFEMAGSGPAMTRLGESTASAPSHPVADTDILLRSRLQMLLQARHQLDQVARPMAAVELPQQNVVPAVLHRAGAAGERE
jgi:hypothetical protein